MYPEVRPLQRTRRLRLQCKLDSLHLHLLHAMLHAEPQADVVCCHNTTQLRPQHTCWVAHTDATQEQCNLIRACLLSTLPCPLPST